MVPFGKARVVRVTSVNTVMAGYRVASGDQFPHVIVADESVQPGDLAVYFLPGAEVPEPLAELIGWQAFEPESLVIASRLVDGVTTDGALVHLAKIYDLFRPFNVGVALTEGADVTSLLNIK